MKKWCGCVLFLLIIWFCPVKAEAASGTIQFTTSQAEVEKGDTFSVVCQVQTTQAFVDATFSIDYDSKILTFLSGGNKVTGGNGTLQVASTGNEQETQKKTFSLQFKAKKKGTTLISLTGTSKIIDADGNSFSISSNELTITVVKKGAVADSKESPTTTDVPKITPQPKLSTENRLKMLRINALSMMPAFSPEVKEYDVTVDCRTSVLYVSYTLQEEKERVLLKGNENLSEGENTVIVRVTSESGDVADYRLHVVKESEAETKERETKEESAGNDISFLVKKEGEKTYIQNAYEFQVLDPSEKKEVPAGYVQTSIELNGISVPVFAVEKNPDSNYLLLYLKGPSGKSDWYQYDREEKTLQRYTGVLTERVNKALAEEGEFSLSLSVLVGIIIGLIVLILCMLIAMLKMAVNRKKEKNISQQENLDFY